MTATRDEFLLTLRNQAIAKARGAVAPALNLTADEQIASLDEVDADTTELADFDLVRRWLAADDTRSLAFVDDVATLLVSAVAEHDLEVTEGRLVVPALVRTALETDLEE